MPQRVPLVLVALKDQRVLVILHFQVLRDLLVFLSVLEDLDFQHSRESLFLLSLQQVQ